MQERRTREHALLEAAPLRALQVKKQKRRCDRCRLMITTAAKLIDYARAAKQ